jgi:RND family efflux transporter MFP subunit
MPKLSEQTRQARRERILDAAERCFVQRGFHRTSMQDICREAGISPGALYIYFASKEDLIAGICERETLQFAEHLELMSEAPDFMTALRTLADTYCVDQPRSKLQLHIEIGAEMIRNEKVSVRVLEVDRFVQERFTSLIERLRREGRIAPSVDSAVAARVLLMVGDGLFWNRALYPDFDPQTLVPAMMTMIETLINPVKAETPAKPAPARKKAMKKSKTMALLAAIITGTMAASMATGCRAEPVAAESILQAPLVGVAEARRTTLTETIMVTGSLAAREEVLVTPQVDGLRITEILSEQGDMVTKGTVLARLDRSAMDAQLSRLEAQDTRAGAAIAQARSQIASAEAVLKHASAAFERSRDLLRTGSSTQATFDEREAAARGATAALASAGDGLRLAEADKAANAALIRELKIKLAFTEITAPASGLVSRRTARLGAIVSSANEPLFRIIDKGELELDAEIPEVYMPKLKTGMGVRVNVSGLPENAGTLRLISPEIDKATRLGRVRIFIGADPSLRSGAFARGQIETARGEGLAVPAGAVLYSDNGAFVQVVRDGKVETRAVKTGLKPEGLVEIAGGLAEGEKLVARSGTLLRDGDLIRPVLAPASEVR